MWVRFRTFDTPADDCCRKWERGRIFLFCRRRIEKNESVSSAFTRGLISRTFVYYICCWYQKSNAAAAAVGNYFRVDMHKSSDFMNNLQMCVQVLYRRTFRRKKPCYFGFIPGRCIKCKKYEIASLVTLVINLVITILLFTI